MHPAVRIITHPGHVIQERQGQLSLMTTGREELTILSAGIATISEKLVTDFCSSITKNESTSVPGLFRQTDDIISPPHTHAELSLLLSSKFLQTCSNGSTSEKTSHHVQQKNLPLFLLYNHSILYKPLPI